MSDVTIKIPRELYNRLQEIIVGTGFRSVTEFVVYVLRDLASTHLDQKQRERAEGQVAGGDQASRTGGGDPALTAEEVELIRRRLKNLGYL